jgi:hypothetical protein
MKAHSEFKVTIMCQMSELSKTAYYDWCGRPKTSTEKANELLTPLIKEIFEGQRYGAAQERLRKHWHGKIIESVGVELIG